MKLSLLITLSSYFFLLCVTLSTKLPLAFSDDKPLPVGAIGGGGPYVRIGEAFYIFPDYPPEDSQGGGLILGQIGQTGQTMKNSTTKCSCPLTVLQNHYDAELNGLPLHFTIPPSSSQHHYSTNSSDDNNIVYTNTSLDITFIHKPINCAKSFKWIVVVDHDFPYPYIGVGGDHDKDYYSGKKIVNGAFHIQNLSDDNYREYSLVFCPTSSSSSLGGCKYIGRYKNDVDAKRLILTDKDPFQVVFFRV